MKAIKLAIIILLGAAAISFIRSDKEFNIIRALPFADGEPVGNIYHWGSLAILGLTFWGYYRLTKKHDEDE